MAGYIKGSKAYNDMIKKRTKEWFILRGLLYEGFDIETCSLIMNQSKTYIRVMIDQFAPVDIESIL